MRKLILSQTYTEIGITRGMAKITECNKDAPQCNVKKVRGKPGEPPRIQVHNISRFGAQSLVESCSRENT